VIVLQALTLMAGVFVVGAVYAMDNPGWRREVSKRVRRWKRNRKAPFLWAVAALAAVLVWCSREKK
jgi:hypothetical protein